LVLLYIILALDDQQPTPAVCFGPRGLRRSSSGNWRWARRCHCRITKTRSSRNQPRIRPCIYRAARAKAWKRRRARRRGSAALCRSHLLLGGCRSCLASLAFKRTAGSHLRGGSPRLATATFLPLKSQTDGSTALFTPRARSCQSSRLNLLRD